ncbi:hypothetical protein [Hymenobacter psychrophilus]|uniref:Dolichyl-phosphate-mannose-protein mannosyltransferase n=1 Tax=Hymenobacter psychrophilus TaxID=651662 RepID=A0A1H3IMC6_9BACT|nr:hypothetical protein [Hymenobacter psychrophilus]SDY27974.1 hypothetical protein SAMN04488069_10748 [Hymenobacter psychrophilus]
MLHSVAVRRFGARAFFGLLLVLGGLLVSDYGVSWDEPTDQRNGLVSLRYLADLTLGHEPYPIEQYRDSDHGVLFELPMTLVARYGLGLVGEQVDRDYYLIRHGLTFLLVLGGLGALYGLARLRLRRPGLALLPVALFVLSPRLFAESFYNAKDLLFLAVFTVGTFTLARLVQRPTLGRALLHGLATAAAVDVRLLGLLLIPFTLGLLLLAGLLPTPPGGPRPRQVGALAGAYLLAAAGATVAGWPYLWADPLSRLLLAFQRMSHFPWQGEVLYWGKLEQAQQLPWHYGPVWLLITTPVAYWLAAGAGLALAAIGLLRRPLERLRTFSGRLDLLFCGWLLLPFALVIGLHSVLYDGWRHLYFVYPALLLLAVSGGEQLWQRGRRSRWGWPLLLGLGLLAGLELGLTAVRMVRMHPQQQVYFSFLTNQQVEDNFERDYWGLAYRQGLEYLVRRHPTGPIYVAATEQTPLFNNLIWLTPADQQRIQLVAEPGPGRYYLFGYRAWPGAAPAGRGRAVYQVKADGLTILSVLYEP